MCCQCPASRSPSRKTKKARLDDSNSSGATLSLIGDGSTSFGSLTPTPIHVPQFTSTPRKATTEARVRSLSRDSDSLAGPHDQMEVFPTDFGQPLPPLTPVPSISGSQPVGGSIYAPPFPLTTGAGGATLNSAQAEEFYTLTSECRLLSIGLARGFCQLSGEEAVGQLQVLTTTQILRKPRGDASNAWEESYAPLLAHVMKFDTKLGTYLDDANKDMTDKATEIWTHIQAVATASDMTPDEHLGLALFLLDRLLVISPGLSFWQDIPFSLVLGPKAITFRRRVNTSHSIPPAPDNSGDAQSNSKASLPPAQVGQATPRSLERNFPDGPGKPVPQITADFEKALPLKHSSPMKTTRLTQESTTDESPKKLQKDDSDSEQSTSSESSIKEEAEIEPAGNSGEDVSGGDRIKVNNAPDGTSLTPGTPLQSGDSDSSEEEDDWEGVISDSTRAAKSSDEDKPAATSTSRDSQGVAPLSLTLLLVKHSEKIWHSKHGADACRLDTHLKNFQTDLGKPDKAVWAKRETMKCGKKHKDPLGAHLEYMKARKVFEPLASSAYGLCHFYDVGMKATKGSVPISCPIPKVPVMPSQLKALLHKGRRQGHPLLIMAITGEVVTPHGLLSKLHMLGALQHLPMKCEDYPVDQPRMKTSFCPFCSYHCCNDSTFLNHIVSFHYDAGYSCGKCVEEVFITSQSFKVHFKECDSLSCDSTDANVTCHNPRRPVKDESPCRRQEQPPKKASVKGDEHAPTGTSRHKKKKAQKK